MNSSSSSPITHKEKNIKYNNTVSSSFQSYIAPSITFLSGAAYGFTNVIVGQPWDVVKTRLQAAVPHMDDPKHPQPPIKTRRNYNLFASSFMSSYQILKDLYTMEGIRGLYRGGLPMIVGGSLMRSVQYGVSSQAQTYLKGNDSPTTRMIIPPVQLLGFIDIQVLLAGAIGGMARSLIEIPTDFIKIRRQVRFLPQKNSTLKNAVVLTWTDVQKHILDGSGVTVLRNTFLFSSFIVYIDISKQFCNYGYVPTWLCTEDGMNLTPFAKGAICANLAWITVWPLDLIKTQQQSGNFTTRGNNMDTIKIHTTNTEAAVVAAATTTTTSSSIKTTATDSVMHTHRAGVSAYEMFIYNLSKGHVFRGLLPGLIRSTMANGASMVAYEWTQTTCTRFFNVERRDIV